MNIFNLGLTFPANAPEMVITVKPNVNTIDKKYAYLYSANFPILRRLIKIFLKFLANIQKNIAQFNLIVYFCCTIKHIGVKSVSDEPPCQEIKTFNFKNRII